MTAASLKTYTLRDLAQMAKRRGVRGWHSMRKDQLVKELLKVQRNGASQRSAVTATATRRAASIQRTGSSEARRVTKSRSAAVDKQGNGRAAPRTNRKLQRLYAQRERMKDLSCRSQANGKTGDCISVKDRIVLMVRDAFWLHTCWELSRKSVERAQAALAEQWYTAQPTLRLLQLQGGNTTSTAERVVRDIPVHGGVSNWYVDVQESPKSYCVEIGYLATSGRFYSLCRSNMVTTPEPCSCDVLDHDWSEVAENGDKILSMSSGWDESADDELRELFEERLRRPMGAPMAAKYGAGAGHREGNEHSFQFQVDAEMIVYGMAAADAYVTLAGEPIKLRPDGTFTVRLSMPDRRQVLPIVAHSRDGMEQHTIILSVNRNTKVLEPVFREAGD